jgi:hypothetical protein
MKNKFYVYVHKRKDTGEIFYVGKGTKNRYKYTYGRNSYWKNIATKYGFESEILYFFDSEEEAFNREISLITTLKTLGQKLANLTNGGEGTFGRKLSDNTINKMKNNRQKSNAHCFKSNIKAINIITKEEFIFCGAQELKEFGLDPGHVYKCILNKRKTHKNFIFQRT